MGNLKVKGRIIYPPGFWGINKPVVGAQVTIQDIDAPGRSNETIWQGSTNSQGGFQGTTSDWQDQILIGYRPVPGSLPPRLQPIYGPDLTDVPVLTITIEQKTPTGNKQITLPFPFLGDDKEGPPILVTWAPPDPVVKVNDNPCYTREEVSNKVREAIDQNKPINLKVYGAEAEALKPLTYADDQLRDWISRQQPQIALVVDDYIKDTKDITDDHTNKALVAVTVATSIPPWFFIFVGISLICVSAAASVVILAVAFAIVWSVKSGYRVKHIGMKTEAQTGLVYLDVEMEKG